MKQRLLQRRSFATRIVKTTQEIRQHVQRDADKEIESINKEIEEAVEHAETQ